MLDDGRKRAPGGEREKRKVRRGPVSNRDQEDTLKFNRIHTKFRFFRPSPDESTVGVV